VLAAVAGVNALAACGGAAGLVLGFLSLTDRVNERLPFASPVLGGLGLAALVALPLTVLTVRAGTGHPRTGETAVVVGVLLIGWILVQVLFLRELSFFHPFYLAVGAGLVVAGHHPPGGD
jgi:hypothetical protein